MSKRGQRRFLDRSGWRAGPWDDEPDEVLWGVDGYWCMARRNEMGVWCGYVGVATNHPLYGMDYEDVPNQPYVHGGLTYSGHLVEALWWFGFDCCHGGDAIPDPRVRELLEAVGLWRKQEYRTLEYVVGECEALVRWVEEEVRLDPERAAGVGRGE